MALVKSGWLWRQSCVLRRWKKHWFDLWLDGNLLYYPDENRRTVEDRFPMKYNCVNASDFSLTVSILDILPPDGSTQESLVTVELRDRSNLLLCAESEDDAVAWQMALMDTQFYPVNVYDPYDDHNQAVPFNAHHAAYINQGYYGHGYVPFIVRDDPYRYSYGEQTEQGILAGAVTGSALRSLVWLPCWF